MRVSKKTITDPG